MSTLRLTRAQVRDVDRRAIEEYGLAGVVLMENAGRGAVDVLGRWGCAGPVVICTGKGNNGGDGFVMARHLAIRGITVHVVSCCPVDQLQGDAAINYRVLQRASMSIRVLGRDLAYAEFEELLNSADWVVDALLGTGAQGEVREPYRGAIEAINRSKRRVLAVDLPSGMDCDTGTSIGACIKATVTTTFVARKPGFNAPGASEFTGQVEVVEIGVPLQLLNEVELTSPERSG